MKYYSIVQFTITKTDWIPAYGEKVTKMLENWGGKYLARTNQVEALEGKIEPHTTMVIVEWPSKELSDSFYDSEEYRPYREARKSGTRGTLLRVAGEDITGEAKM